MPGRSRGPGAPEATGRKRIFSQSVPTATTQFYIRDSRRVLSCTLNYYCAGVRLTVGVHAARSTTMTLTRAPNR